MVRILDAIAAFKKECRHRESASDMADKLSLTGSSVDEIIPGEMSFGLGVKGEELLVVTLAVHGMKMLLVCVEGVVSVLLLVLGYIFACKVVTWQCRKAWVFCCSFLTSTPALLHIHEYGLRCFFVEDNMER